MAAYILWVRRHWDAFLEITCNVGGNRFKLLLDFTFCGLLHSPRLPCRGSFIIIVVTPRHVVIPLVALSHTLSRWHTPWHTLPILSRCHSLCHVAFLPCGKRIRIFKMLRCHLGVYSHNGHIAVLHVISFQLKFCLAQIWMQHSIPELQLGSPNTQLE